MDSATIRFFSIPELLQSLEHLLSQPSFTALAQVDRRLYGIFTPLIYKTISLQPKSGKNLFDSLNALESSFRFTREITLDGRCCGAFSRSLRDFEEVQASQAEASALDTNVRLNPSSLGSVMPSPPQMTSLTRLLSYGTYSFKQPVDLAYKAEYDNGTYLTHLRDILRFCSRLVDIHLRYVPIHNMQDVIRLATAVTALDSLRDVQLSLRFSDRDLKIKAVSPIFFALPKGVEVLELDLQSQRPAGTPSSTGEANPVVATSQLARREVPLYRLRSWGGLYSTRQGLEAISAMFSHCPELEQLDIPNYCLDADIQEVARVITISCPKLKHLYYVYNGQDPFAFLLVAIITAMAQDTLVSLEYIGAMDGEHLLAKSLERHFGTLKRIDIQCCYYIESITIQTILTGCRVLEMLAIGGCYNRHEISLAEAIAQQWASSRIRHLALEINIGNLEDLRKATVYTRALPIVFEDTEADRMRQLERLYRQLGSLVQLEYLDLRIVVDVGLTNGQEECLDYRSFSFPCLMVLKDEDAGRPGYLHLLAGWKNLKTLEGSFYADTEEAKLTFDEDVSAWILKHWPRLERAPFLPRTTFVHIAEQGADSQVPLILTE
ncbi:hypothetical protein EC991_005460 [Linnemannia zychae]|nr:hypothetical protein EC991_005460 [Linnemannia zychae]